ncbi:glycosyltransferase family 4 protein [Frigoribacterium salinisoli]
MPADLGGVGRYVLSLARAVASRGRVDLVVVAQPPVVDGLRAALPGAEVVAAPALTSRTALRLAWEQLGLPLLARRLGVDVVHSPHYTLPVASRRTRVVTLHDATFFSSPEWHLPVKARFFRTWTRIAVRLADGVVTPSRATADAVATSVRHPLPPVDVAPLGVDPAVFHPPRDEDRAVLARSVPDLPRSWIAFLGTLEPRKNVPALIEAARQLAVSRRAAGGPAPALLLAGSRGWDDAVDEAVAAASSDLDVRRLGYLPLEALAALLGDADVVAYPSLGEGFGLPVLEAMSCGAVVVTTRRLSLPEVGGDAVLYAEVDPSSLAGTLDEASRPGAAPLRARARARAGSFSWDRCAGVHEEAWARARGRRTP